MGLMQKRITMGLAHVKADIFGETTSQETFTVKMVTQFVEIN
jgi:hypothetical protein